MTPWRFLLTLKQAAAELGVTPDNLRGAIKRGSFKAKKVGRDWFVTEAEVARYQTEHRRIRERIEDSADEIALAEEGQRIAAPVSDD